MDESSFAADMPILSAFQGGVGTTKESESLQGRHMAGYRPLHAKEIAAFEAAEQEESAEDAENEEGPGRIEGAGESVRHSLHAFDPGDVGARHRRAPAVTSDSS